MSEQQHETLNQITVTMLHSAILQTGSDVRALGTKLDVFTAAQNGINTNTAVELSRLKTVDEAQQKDLDALKVAPEKHKANKIMLWSAVVGGSLGLIGCIIQAMVALLHK